ncbi:DUF4911 domain-containing protein [Desulfovulcanus sp.]
MSNSYSKRLYLQLDRKYIALFKFFLEGYDNLAYLTVVDKYKAVLQLVYSHEFEEFVYDFIKNVQLEIQVKIVYDACKN